MQTNTESPVVPRGALLVGSVALDDADQVFRLASQYLSDRLRRIPDGETGDRRMWIGWQAGLLARVPELQREDPPRGQPPSPKFRPKPGVDPATIDLHPLAEGYSQAATDSYATFTALKQGGVIPETTRFQVSLPTPLAGSFNYTPPDARAVMYDPYDRAMRRALVAILDEIPHDELAIQWDVCTEIGFWERPYLRFDSEPEPNEADQQAAIERLEDLGSLVPEDVELGYHLCYGDMNHKHFTEPADASVLVTIAQALSDGLVRPINWIHIPVPRSRADAAYFAPLRNLRLQPGTELYLGLVHLTHGTEGTRRRIAAAATAVSDFGVATECGMGRRPDHHDMGELMKIHREVSAPIEGT